MIAVKAKTIHTIAKGILKNGMILIDEGKIVNVGNDLSVPPEANVLDLGDSYVMPGLIDCHTHLSVHQDITTNPGTLLDVNEGSDPITPQIHALDAFNPQDPAIPRVRRAGFTTVYTGPGSANCIGGQGFALKLRGSTVEEMYIPGTEMMKFALGENPKRFYGGRKLAPWTRMGTAALMRKALYEAKCYSDQLREAEKDPKKRPGPDFKLDALVPAVRGEQRVRIHCHRADDIMTAIRISEEFGLDYVLEHCTEGYKIKDVLAEKKCRCVIGPLRLGPLKQEVWDIRMETPGILSEAGIPVCLTADTAGNTAWLPMEAGLCVRRGLSEEEALKGLTIYPARVLGLEKRIGTIEPGKDADLAVFDGNPLDNLTLCQGTMIEGIYIKSDVHEKYEEVYV